MKILLFLHSNSTIVISLFKRSKNREEIKLQRGLQAATQWTPGVPDTEVPLMLLHMCVALRQFTRQSTPELPFTPQSTIHICNRGTQKCETNSHLPMCVYIMYWRIILSILILFIYNLFTQNRQKNTYSAYIRPQERSEEKYAARHN